MKKWFLDFLNKSNKAKVYLVFSSVLLVFFLILFGNLGFFPLSVTDFVFFVLIILASALYRPGWTFLLLLGVIMLENVDLAPKTLGFSLRPYQLIGGLLFLAMLVKFFMHKLHFQLARLKASDYFLLLIPLGSGLHLLDSNNVSAGLKFILIICSFLVLFWLARNYIQTVSSLKKGIIFFIVPSAIILLYAIWQNWRFAHGENAFMVMDARPNSTLTEPDWLGLLSLLFLSISYALIFFLAQRKSFNQYIDREKEITSWQMVGIFFYLILVFVVLIISVSRSAWLGAFTLTLGYFVLLIIDLKKYFYRWKWKLLWQIKLAIFGTLLCAMGIIYAFNLTTFQLFNRARSVGTGAQKITISCGAKIDLPDKILDISELDAFNCRHINLEEIENETLNGRFIKEIDRNDPNVNIRAEIYQKALREIQAHPIAGIGWENISAKFGIDGRGAGLNSSNIFLETYLGAGIFGFVGLLAVFVMVFLQAWRLFLETKELEEKAFAIFVLISWVGIVVFNLFNAGIMLGFFWVWLGIVNMQTLKTKNT